MLTVRAEQVLDCFLLTSGSTLALTLHYAYNLYYEYGESDIALSTCIRRTGGMVLRFARGWVVIE